MSSILTSAKRVPRDMPKIVQLEDVDAAVESLRGAMDSFDTEIHASLASTHDWKDSKDVMGDIIPREEVFLISSFYLNMRQSALHILQMLEHSRGIMSPITSWLSFQS